VGDTRPAAAMEVHNQKGMQQAVLAGYVLTHVMIQTLSGSYFFAGNAVVNSQNLVDCLYCNVVCSAYYMINHEGLLSQNCSNGNACRM
jgi:hypothetical protein